MTNKEAIKNINALNAVCGQKDFYDSEFEEALGMAVEALESQKTGHWIRWYEEVEYITCTENIPHCKCSECNKEYNPYTSKFIKYCSQCGAKMEGESNAE